MTINSLRLGILPILLFTLNSIYSQSTDAVRAPLSVGYYWKDLPVIQSILENEIAVTNAALGNPKNTDKNKGILIGYLSLINNFKRSLSVTSNFSEELERAFEFVKNEDVGIPYKRILIVNDIFIKKEELILKLTTK